MKQPNYSPQEALERVKLMMGYDLKKTLKENKEVIFEDSTINPRVATYTAGGALAGAGIAGGGAAAMAAGAGIGSVFPVVGTAVGALVGLGVGVLANWAANKDGNSEGFKKLMGVCRAPGANKLVPQLSKADVRNIAYAIEDAKGDWNDDEDAIVDALQKIPTIADLCAVDKKIVGGLYKFLDDLTDSPSEWRMFARPIEGMIEDTEIVLTPEEQKKANVTPTSSTSNKSVKTSKYKPCSGTYKYLCKADPIETVQACLGLVPDGKFGPKTQAKLKSLGYESFTDADINKICGKEQVKVEPEVSGEDMTINTTDTNF